MFLSDVWPSAAEVAEVAGTAVTAEMFARGDGLRRGVHAAD